MQSPARSTRKAAFQEILDLTSAGQIPKQPDTPETVNKLLDRNPNQADAVRVGLINLLEIETTRIHALHSLSRQVTDKGKTIASETTEAGLAGEDEYYPKLIGIVAALEDERAIHALLGAATTGGMATRAVAKFGDKALGPTLDLLKDQDSMVRSSALFTIRNMLKMHTLRETSSTHSVDSILRASLQDPAFIVRNSAISAIEYLPNREELVPILSDLAEHDEQRLVVDASVGVVYPVRLKAKRLLQKIANHEQRPVDADAVR